MNAVELFCGYGGATAGMLTAGLTIEAAYDLDKQAVAAHKQWHPNVPVERRDVAEVTPDELAGKFVWASPSCRPWSTANRIRRGLDHPDYYPLSKLLEQARDAEVMVIENVCGLVFEKDGQAELERAGEAAQRLGMSMSIHVLYSHWYGIPQYRRRVFIAAGRTLPLLLLAQGKPPAGAVYAVCATEHPGQFQTNERGHFGPAVMTAEHRGSGNRIHTRPGRSLTECAKLQGVPIPKGFSKMASHRLVGNCVPPVLAEAVCRAVLEAM